MRAERAVGSWWDEDTQSTLTTWEVLYDGPARIQQHNVTGPDDTAGDVDQRRRYLVAAGLECPALPHDTPVLVVECGDAMTVHDYAALVGYFASGIYPYLAHDLIVDAAAKGKVKVSAEEAVANYNKAVTAGIFREDLFFRLNVLELESPPLRERLEDLPLLVGRLLARLSEKNHKSARGVSPAFLRVLTAYAWPGNVRELENVLERALVLSRSDILEPTSLPAHIVSPQSETGLRPDATARQDHTCHEPHAPEASPLEEAERHALIQALESHGGHREKTADALGISRRTLQYKLKKFGLSRRG